MSRKGKSPIPLPKGLEVKVQNNELSIKGSKGTLKRELLPFIEVKTDAEFIHVGLKDERSEWGKYHGLYRSLIQNMVTGVTTGFEVKLEMIGVGYRANVQGTQLDLQIGNSHPTKLPIPNGVTVKVDKNTAISVTGMDKQVVGQFAADIRSMKPPEPYQGKGIRYVGEHVRRKQGKAAAKSK